MAGLFKRIGDSIRSALGQNPDKIDKLNILSEIESLAATVAALKDAYGEPNLGETFQTVLRGKDTKSVIFRKVYETYNASLSSGAHSLESQVPLLSYTRTLAVIELDLKNLFDNFTAIFGSGQDAEIDMTDLHVSDAIILGYINNTVRLCRWGTYMLAIGLHPSDEAIPPYQGTWALKNAGNVAGFVTSLLNRPSHSDLVTKLAALRRAGKDAALQTDGATIDQYASDNDYDYSVHTAMNGFIPSIGLMVGKHRIEHQRAQVDELKHIQNWLRNKISLMQLDLSRKDPQSPEYRRIKTYVDNYMKDLTATDKKLASYEAV